MKVPYLPVHQSWRTVLSAQSGCPLCGPAGLPLRAATFASPGRLDLLPELLRAKHLSFRRSKARGATSPLDREPTADLDLPSLPQVEVALNYAHGELVGVHVMTDPGERALQSRKR
jgi:hypothetical protein